MNKVLLMGRLTNIPELLRAKNGMAVVKYTLAVPRRFKKAGEAGVDFIPCVAFDKAAEFAEKYFSKGQQVSIVGRLQVSSWDDKDGRKRWTTEAIVEEQYFADSKKGNAGASASGAPEGFNYADNDGDLPF